ncbi:MAG: alpha/beta hydrolase, partial [Pseudomonadota bacterium]
PVICLPGLTRNTRDFDALADALAGDTSAGPAMRVLGLDARGRGGSTHADPATYTIPHELGDLVAVLDHLKIDEARFVGTSRGGILTMALAMTAPERVERAVLNDIGARIEPTGLTRIAGEVGQTMEYPSYEVLAQTLATRLGPQFPRLDGDDFIRFAHQVASPHSNGGIRFDYDEKLGDVFQATSESAAEPDLWPAFDALARRPVLILRGVHSDILSAATVEAMRRHAGAVETYVVPGEGHAPLLWDRQTIERVKVFLSAPDFN